MSTVNPESLKSPASDKIPFLTRPEIIGVATITHDSLNEFQKIIKSVKIVNDDGVNNLQYRTQSPSSPLRTVPPNSEDTFDEWTSFLQIIPNAVTGAGLLELDLVEPKDAKQPLKNKQVTA